jgi:hypothetical protein
MNIKPVVRILSLCLFTAVAGCSFVERNTIGLVWGDDEPKASASEEKVETHAAPRTSPVDIQPLKQSDAATGIELIIEIPDHPVDKFVVNYGFEPEDLTNTFEIPATKLERFQYGEQGYVYRYLIDTLPSDRKIYLTFVSVSGQTVSEPSKVYEVEPEAN